jgi:antirestriction protein ArdC
MEAGEQLQTKDRDDGDAEARLVLREDTVFNVDQCEELARQHSRGKAHARAQNVGRDWRR